MKKKEEQQGQLWLILCIITGGITVPIWVLFVFRMLGSENDVSIILTAIGIMTVPLFIPLLFWWLYKRKRRDGKRK